MPAKGQNSLGKNLPASRGSLGVIWRMGAVVLTLGSGLLFSACGGDSKPNVSAEDLTVYLDKGQAYLNRGNAVMALPALQEAQAIDPDNLEVLVALGLAYDGVGRSQQALAVLEKAHEIEPHSGQISNNLGVAHMRLGQLEEAEKAFGEALQDLTYATPEDAQFNLALLYKRRGETEKMMTALTRTIDYNPGHLGGRLELADHYRDVGKPSLEKQQLQMGLAEHPDHLVLMERLAKAYVAAGEQEGARAVYGRIARLAPQSESGKRAIHWLSAVGTEE
ncbi:MAG: tetratricopeptide repeat protein [Magnetococcales bacterium]|nr:tetratricopeptide repeat protein [Magnetococcales bacterium]